MVGRKVSLLTPSLDHEQHDGYLQRYFDPPVLPRIIGMIRIVRGLRADGNTFPMKLWSERSWMKGKGFSPASSRISPRSETLKSGSSNPNQNSSTSPLQRFGHDGLALAHKLNQPLTRIASYQEAAASTLEALAGLNSAIYDA